MLPGPRTPLRDLRFRANPDYELVLFDRLSATEQETFKALGEDPDSYGILRPRRTGALGVKSVSRDLALLFYTLREPGALPHYARQSLAHEADRLIAQMVLDGILEIDVEGKMVSGPAALPFIDQDEIAPAGPEKPIAALSRRAIEYAQALDLTDPGALSMRLYDYNRIPASPRWRSLIPDRAAADRFLDIANGAGTGILEQSWTRNISAPDGHWISWQAPESNYNSSMPVYKLYVSPAMDHLREAFQAAAAVSVRTRAWSIKVGADLYGLLRPDKIVIYLKSSSDVQETAERLLRLLGGCPGQGVPFSAAAGGGYLLSFGIDPPRDRHTVPWLERESWRLWITNRLAAALVLARQSIDSGIEPCRFAFERLRLEGIDTRTWAPSGN
jgi:hypothetical protein